MGKLTHKQRKFVEEYLKCWNATRAAINAGYSERTARSIGHENLTKPDIAARVRERLAQSAMEADEVLHHLAEIARGDIDDMLNDSGEPDVDRARETSTTRLIKRWRIRTITTENSVIHEIEIEPYDRLKALTQLGRRHGLFIDRQRNEDWRSDLIEAVRGGQLNFDDVAAELKSRELAAELFAEVGLPVNVSEDEG